MNIKTEEQFNRDAEAGNVNGLYRMSQHKYRNADGVNQSALKEFDDDPAGYKYNLMHPKPDTPSQIEGKIFESLVLTDRDFPIKIAPKKLAGKTRASKDWKTWAADQGNVELVKRNEGVEFLRMKHNVLRSEQFKRLIGKKCDEQFCQIAVFWYTSSGVVCKALIDYLDPNGLFAVDLKKQKDVSDWGWQKANEDYKHFCQEPWYMEGLSKHLPAIDNFYFCTVQGTAPYRCVWRQILRDDAQVGAGILLEALPKFVKAKEVNRFESSGPKSVVAIKLTKRTLGIPYQSDGGF